MHIKADIGQKNYMIKNYNNVLQLDLFEKLWLEIRDNPWWFDHQTKPDSTKFFSQHISENYVFKEPFLELAKNIKKLIQPNFEEELLPFWIKVNGQVYGQNGCFHNDSSKDGVYTFVFFPLPNWNLSWGGEFIIFDPTKKEYLYTPPLPNSGVLFPSKYEHVGMGPNRECSIIRVSVAINFIIKSREKLLDEHGKKVIY